MLSTCFEVNLNLSLINIAMEHLSHPFRKCLLNKLVLWCRAMYSSRVHARRKGEKGNFKSSLHAICLQALSNLILM